MRRFLTIIIPCVILAMLNVTNMHAGNIEWNYYDKTHTLIINKGDIGDYNTSSETPWYKYKDDIKTVVVKPGVTAIGNNAFAKFSKLAFISLPSGLLTIGDYAFAETAVEQLVIPASVKTIGGAAFLWCDKLRTIYMGGGVTRLGSTGTSDQDYGAFAYCNAVSDIYFYQNNIKDITWNNTWEFKDDQATKVHVYESASLPTELICKFISDIGNDLRSIGQNDISNPDKPYEIYYRWQMDFITAVINSTPLDDDSPDIYLKLMADIEYDQTDPNNFTPIGSGNNSFKGTFDGNGHKLSGINIKSQNDFVGIFPYVMGTVKNIKFYNVHITTTGSFVGVIGALSASTIENITIENSSFQADNSVGPLVGLVEEGDEITAHTIIKNCHVKSKVIVNATNQNIVNYSYAGGLVGRAYAGCSIYGSTSQADVTGKGQYVAGIVGYNLADLADCIYLGTSLGSATSYSCPVSDNVKPNSIFESNCFYTSASFTDNDSRVRLANPITFGDGVTFVNEALSTYGTTDFPGITFYDGFFCFDGKYYAAKGTSFTFSDYDAWYIVNGECVRTYVIDMQDKPINVTLFAIKGKGTEEEPYLISNTDELDYMAKKVNSGNSLEGKLIQLTADIVYDGTDNNYTPIGENLNGWHLFEGVFDGKGHSISGIKVKKLGNDTDSRSRYNGIFGAVGRNGIVKNLICDNITFVGRYMGGIVGYNEGIIENCRVGSNVKLYASGSGATDIGGVVGYQPERGYGVDEDHDGPAIIRGCVSFAYVSDFEYHNCKRFGGIIGYNGRKTSNILHCLYLGKGVYASPELGGDLAGAIAGWNSPDITHFSSTYYTYEPLVSDNTLAFRLAHQLNIPEGSEIDSEKTVYGEGDYVGVTAYENRVLYYDGVYYAPKDLEISLKFTGTLGEGKEPLGLDINPSDSWSNIGGATSEGMTLTMGSTDINLAVVFRNAITEDMWIYHRSNSFSDMSETDKLLVLHKEEELARFAYEVNVLGNTFEGWTVKLADDKDFIMSAYLWEPIGSFAMPNNVRLFKGTFDGNRREISGVKASVNDNCEGLGNSNIGFFSLLPKEAVVKNLFMDNATVSGAKNVGVVAGESNGTVTNCHVCKSSVTAMAVNADCLGGVVGKNLGGSITNCSVNKTTISDGDGFIGASHFGGICGSNITNAENTASGNEGNQLKEAIVDNNLFFGDIKVSGYAPLGFFGAITGENKAAKDAGGNEYPAKANNNYYDASATVVVINRVHEGDGTHAYNTSLGLGIGQASENGSVGYTSTDAEGVAELLIINGRDNTKALNLLVTRDQYFNRPTHSLLNAGRHPYTLKGWTLYRDGRWNTICLPFDFVIIYDSPVRTSTIRELTGSAYDKNTQTLTLSFEDAEGHMFKAGKPFIWKSYHQEADVVDPVFNDVAVLTTELQDIKTEFATFKGTYAPVVLEKESGNQSVLFMGADNKLYYPKEEAERKIDPFRAYFQLAKGVLNFNLGDVNGDGILTVTDVMLLVNYVMGGVNDDFVMDNADVNGDGQISVTDVMGLVNMVVNDEKPQFNVVVNFDNAPISFDGEGSGPARAGENHLWSE